MNEHDPNEDDAHVYPPDDPEATFTVLDGSSGIEFGELLPDGPPSDDGPFDVHLPPLPDDLPPGLASCEEVPVPSGDSSDEHEVALAVGRTLDALSQLTKFLPLPEHVGDRLRADLYCAWRRAQRDCGVCEDDTGVDHG